MKFFLSLSLVFIIIMQSNINAQDCFNTKSDKFKRIKNSTLIISVSNSVGNSYIEILKDAFAKQWKYSKYKFILESEISKYFDKAGYVFHGNFKFSVNQNTVSFNHFGIWGSYSGQEITDMMFLRPIAYMNVGDIFEVSTYDYCLPNILKAFNDFMFYADSTQFKGGMGPLYKTLGSDIVDYYNAKAKTLKGKTLYILNDQVDQLGKDMIAKNYSGKILYVDENTIKKAIINGEDNIAHLYLAQSSVSIFMYIYNVKGEIIFLERDVYGVSKAVTKKIILNKKNINSFCTALNKYMTYN